LEAADTNSNQSARLQAYQQAEQELVDDVAWLPVEQVTQVFLRQPYVIGVVDNALGLTPPDDWAKIYIAQH
jgi:oligopeptide transport system substrate-binding protein